MSAKTRKTFLFGSEGIDLLTWLKSACEVRTDAEVVRYALGALADLMIADREGKTIFIRAQDGSEVRYHPVFTEDGEPEPEVRPERLLQLFRSRSKVAA